MKKFLHLNYRQLFLFLLWFFVAQQTIAQPCVCVNCPKLIPDLDTIELPINITGATSGTLGANGQNVCKVCINFKHEFVSDLEIKLISPSGQAITLVAPISQTGFTLGATWNVCFVPCTQPAAPDPGFPANWTNGNWANFGNYKGSYYPFIGCLNDFTGSVNGTWKLVVKDGDPLYNGEVLSWGITFCNPSGIDCLSCVANAGDYSKIPAITACKGDNSLVFNPVPVFTSPNQIPPANLYSSTNVIVKNNLIVGYQNPVNMSNFQAGDYSVCGFSFLISDAAKLPPGNGTFTLTQLQNMIVGINGAKAMMCGKFSKGCIPVKIKAPPAPVFVNKKACKSYKYSNTTYTQSGLYTEKFVAKNGCDSLVYIDLKITAPVLKDTFSTICQGNFFNVGIKKYSKTGIYKDTLISKKTGCDSILTLFLTVKSPPVNNISKTICKGESVKIGKVIHDFTGVFKDTLQTNLGCDSIVNLNLQVNPISTKKIDTTLCFKNNFVLNKKTYKKSGIYRDTLLGKNSLGCDSIIILNLKVLPDYKDTLRLDICQGDKVKIGKNIYDKTGNYLDTLKTSKLGCDSLVWTFLKVSSKINKNLVAHICQGSFYDFDGKKLDKTGVYTAKNLSKNGCDSLSNLTLTVHQNPSIASLKKTLCFNDTLFIGTNEKYFSTGKYTSNLKTAYGCDSILNIDLTILPDYKTVLNIDICEGETYDINGIIFSKSGTYNNVLKTKLYKCDSLVVLNLVVKKKYLTKIDTNVCFGNSVKIGANVFTKSGFFTEKLKAKNGCDSIVELKLNVRKKAEINISKSICLNSFYQIGNKKYNKTGIYLDTLKNSFGCDSFVRLDLKVLPQIITNLNEKICSGENFPLNGKLYDKTGIYKDTLKANGNCDSVIILDLKVNSPSFKSISISICEGDCYKLKDSTFCKSGLYKVKLKNYVGCDSTIFIDLKVKPRPLVELTQSICEGDTVYVGKKKKYFFSGIFNDTLVAKNGCDSIVLLDLTVKPKVITDMNQTLCYGESVVINGKKYDKKGVFKDILKNKISGCDSILIITIDILKENKTKIIKKICKGDSYLGYSLSGSYDLVFTAKNGCDSLIKLNLEVLDSIVVALKDTVCVGSKQKFGDSTFVNSGFYKVKLLTQNGCDSIINLNLLFASCGFKYEIRKTDIGCGVSTKGSFEISLDNTYVGSVNLKIYEQNALANETNFDKNTKFEYGNLNEGIYILKFKNIFGEIKYDTIKILVLPNINASFSKVSNFKGYGVECPNSKNGFIETTVTGGKKPYKYAWNIGEKIPNLSNLRSGKYSLTVTDTLGCSVTIDTILKSPEKVKLTFSVKNNKCYESNDGELKIDSVFGSVGPYLYGIDFDNFSSNKKFVNLSAKVHLLAVLDANNCETDTIFYISEPPKIVVNLGKDTTIDLGQKVLLEGTVNLTPSEIGSVKWNDFITPDCLICLSTTQIPGFSTGYILYVTDKNGCQGFDVKTVFVNDSIPVYTPSAFSPNDDGFNDKFTIFTDHKVLKINTLKIFNRWGDMVFEQIDFLSNDPDQGWDGKYKDVNQQSALFIFTAEIELVGGQKKIIKGELNLIR